MKASGFRLNLPCKSYVGVHVAVPEVSSHWIVTVYCSLHVFGSSKSSLKDRSFFFGTTELGKGWGGRGSCTIPCVDVSEMAVYTGGRDSYFGVQT